MGLQRVRHDWVNTNKFWSLYWTCYKSASISCSVFWPQGIWELTSRSRSWIHTLCTGRQSVSHWTARKVPKSQGFRWYLDMNVCNVYVSIQEICLILGFNLSLLMWITWVHRKLENVMLRGRLKNCFCTEFCCVNLKTYYVWIKLAYWKDHIVKNWDSLAVRLPTPDLERGDFRSFHISWATKWIK